MHAIPVCSKLPGVILRRIFVKNWSKFGGRWMLGLLLTVLAVAQCFDDWQLPLVARMDTFFHGLRLRIQTPVLDPRIVIIDIDEKSLNEIGRWPWSRNIVADLVIRLCDQYQAKAVGFDVMFAEPDTSSGYATLEALAHNELKDIPAFGERLQTLKAKLNYDGQLADALRNRPVVLGYFLSPIQKKGLLPAPAFTSEFLNGRTLDAFSSLGFEANLDQLQRAARSGGFFNADVDADGVLRSSLLLAKVGDGYFQSLSLATASVYLQATAVNPILDRTVDSMSERERRNGGLSAIAIYYLSQTRRAIRIPVGHNLSTVIQFRGRGGPDGGAFRYVSAADILKGRIAQGALAGKILLVGTTAPGLNDLRATPVTSEFPGVEVHANLIASILDGSFKHRPDYALALELIQVTLLGLALCFLLPKLRPAYAISLAVAAAALVLGLNFLLYASFDSLLRLANPLLLIAALFVINIAWGYLFEFRNRQAIVNRFGEYVAPELVAEMADNPTKYNMEGESRELTVLFVDVRGFTTISEGMTPKALREFINIYLTAMSEDIRGNRGTLDKYIGDAVMAFWGAPVELPDHAARAVATALKMLETAQRLNDEFIARGWPALKIGIGLNSGQMHVGDMGSRIRRAYTVMGDAVNLSSRLEGITKVYGVGLVVGEATKLAAPAFFYRELDCVRVKGKNAPVPIFEPIALAADVDSQRRDAIARWHAAYALIRRQNWDAAQEVLEQLQQLYPDDHLYALYLERIAYYRQHPPGPDWDGVTTFETK
jgi:adenylate cyclase